MRYRKKMCKRTVCRVPVGGIDHIYSFTAVINNKEKKVKLDLQWSSISQLHLEPTFHPSVLAMMSHQSHQPGHTGKTHCADYERLMGCPS